jgi:hypothetical protein
LFGNPSECCEKSCKLFSCPQGYISTNTSPEIVGSSNACCEESCEVFSCPQGYISTNTSPEIVGSSDACCEESCEVFSCPQGYISTNTSPEIVGSSNACCEESCEVFSCPQGYLPIDSPQVGRTWQACCTLPKVVAASLFQEGSTGFGDKFLGFKWNWVTASFVRWCSD